MNWRNQVNIFIGTMGVILSVFLFSAVTQLVTGTVVSYVPETLAAVTAGGGARMAQTAFTETRYATAYASQGWTPPPASVGSTAAPSTVPPTGG